MVPAVEGSSPFTHPSNKDRALLAQLDRATDFGSVGRGFESCRARQVVVKVKWTVSSVGRAADS